MHYICTEKDLEKNTPKCYQELQTLASEIKSEHEMCFLLLFLSYHLYLFTYLSLIYYLFFFQIFHSTHGLLLQLDKSYCKKCIDVILYKF